MENVYDSLYYVVSFLPLLVTNLLLIVGSQSQVVQEIIVSTTNPLFVSVVALIGTKMFHSSILGIPMALAAAALLFAIAWRLNKRFDHHERVDVPSVATAALECGHDSKVLVSGDDPHGCKVAPYVVPVTRISSQINHRNADNKLGACKQSELDENSISISDFDEELSAPPKGEDLVSVAAPTAAEAVSLVGYEFSHDNTSDDGEADVNHLNSDEVVSDDYWFHFHVEDEDSDYGDHDEESVGGGADVTDNLPIHDHVESNGRHRHDRDYGSVNFDFSDDDDESEQFDQRGDARVDSAGSVSSNSDLSCDDLLQLRDGSSMGSLLYAIPEDSHDNAAHDGQGHDEENLIRRRENGAEGVSFSFSFDSGSSNGRHQGAF